MNRGRVLGLRENDFFGLNRQARSSNAVLPCGVMSPSPPLATQAAYSPQPLCR